MITLLTSCTKTPDETLGKIPEETVLTGTESNIPTAAKNTTYNIPPYDGSSNTLINNDIPFFTKDDLIMTPFENYSKLDELGRYGTAYANICTEAMPKKPREDISEIKHDIDTVTSVTSSTIIIKNSTIMYIDKKGKNP